MMVWVDDDVGAVVVIFLCWGHFVFVFRSRAVKVIPAIKTGAIVVASPDLKEQVMCDA